MTMLRADGLRSASIVAEGEAMSEERVAVKIMEVAADEDAGAQFVVLQDDAGREMRVFIGKFEAQSLALGLYGAVSDPKTYEAMLTGLTVAGAVVVEACIHDLRNERFYARVSLRVGEQLHSVDIRPSDALNLAVRADCPFFVSDEVFSQQQADASAAGATAEKGRRTPSVSVPVQEPTRLTAAEVSAELARLFAEDQADRTPPPGRQIDWDVVGPRDSVRLARVKQMCRSQSLTTGVDYYHAAMVLQHAHAPEDYLLAHELCIIALSKGVEPAKWLAAASEDRFLMNIGRPQRFGTQYHADAGGKNWHLHPVDPEFSDGMRRAFNVPTLSEAQAHLEEMNQNAAPPTA